ncbi:MAG: Holliday junction branch migration protein RuvA [Clostridiaceae bacterium]|jgi:Holliday junction DNA helicase RuvA|nr:Holliday junction branch migration protein RuvA [Clostridiaceae bacterium]
MFDYIKGTLSYYSDTYAVVDVGGIGYKIATTAKSLGIIKPGEAVTFYTYLHIRDSIMDIYGFTDTRERSTFMLLISVSGVGPKVGISILSAIAAEDLALAVVSNDTKLITIAPGVGKKLAERIILELKDKIKAESLDFDNSISALPQASLESEAAEALVVLGYAPSAAIKAIKNVEKGLTLEETIKKALQNGAVK